MVLKNTVIAIVIEVLFSIIIIATTIVIHNEVVSSRSPIFHKLDVLIFFYYIVYILVFILGLDFQQFTNESINVLTS